MKVKRMIEQLEKLDPEAEVKVGHHTGNPVLFVLAAKNIPGTVWLETEFDCDLKAELDARWENAIEEQPDELDFYIDLLEMGITIDIVRRYRGDEDADHMKEFCEEHGLI